MSKEKSADPADFHSIHSIRPTSLFISASLHVLSSKLFPVVWRHMTNLHWFFLLVFHRIPPYFRSVKMRWNKKHNLFLCSFKQTNFFDKGGAIAPKASDHKFLHYFQNTLNPIWSCGDDIKTTIHYLLHCPNYLDERRTFMDNLQSIWENIHDKKDSQISELLLFDVPSNNDASDTCISNATIQYILTTKKLDVPLTST